jgi:hypothetical protein
MPLGCFWLPVRNDGSRADPAIPEYVNMAERKMVKDDHPLAGLVNCLLLIKPATGTRPAPPRTPGQIIRKTRNNGQTLEESRAATTAPASQSVQTDRQALLTDA